jgi:hypothetical protein
MKIKTSELTGTALDWAVAKCEGVKVEKIMGLRYWSSANWHQYSTDWAQAGPIIERNNIGVICQSVTATGKYRCVELRNKNAIYYYYGPTILIAAMRCYCRSKFGNEVEIPEELC